ncbi:PP2C family protein-serine/threonine phosphatase [Pacificibacter marinus]|uniref:Phosphoserine phosphatase RsbP n=1 Tax=Pacificibacter marinus TaxID=658057 RepID=A0A1Y5T4S4_9RHOB|nr:SpoIIE family protein phosphatase [Pacificibacter marinus]SEL37847.1 Serine phosphatase RsbU, regulator of sigma subunit [Pacificibacter marinus]SLN55391.1 Phosphoserine phosphatase RsbP [Pacificibacter marinus]
MEIPLDIIVAEDNLVQRTYLSRMIAHLGHVALVAEDGMQALKLVQSTGAQILITDFDMPNMNGLELTRAVRDLNFDHYVHIIMLTGSGQSETSAEALDAGVDDFLTKGNDPTHLNARIRVASRLVHHAREQQEQHRILKEINNRIQEDLKAAADAQRQLLPAIHRDIGGIHVASAFVPSAMVSGDMFGCFALPQNKLGLYAVDVSGHGIHASLLSVAIGHLITPEFFCNAACSKDGKPDPAGLVSNLNQRFSAADNDEYFTMFCAIIDTDTGHMDFCQAGYPSPTYVDENGQATLVGEGGFPVGMFSHFSYDNDTFSFEEGGSLVLCSDAAGEAENEHKTPYGVARLRSLISQNHICNANELPDIIVQDLKDWRNGRALEDDLTVVALKRKNS